MRQFTDSTNIYYLPQSTNNLEGQTQRYAGACSDWVIMAPMSQFCMSLSNPTSVTLSQQFKISHDENIYTMETGKHYKSRFFC